MLPALHRDGRTVRIARQDVLLADIEGGECPFAAIIGELLLDADFDLSPLAQPETALGFAQGEQAGDGIMPLAVLGIQVGALIQPVARPQTPRSAAQGALEMLAAGRVRAGHLVQVAPDATHQQPLFVHVPGIFQIEGMLAYARIKARNGSIRAAPPAMFRRQQRDRRGTTEGCVAVQGKVRAGDVPANGNLMIARRQLQAQTVAHLAGVMADFQVGVAIDPSGGGVVPVSLHILPVPVGIETVGFVVQPDPVLRRPFAFQTHALVLVADVAIGHVVVIACHVLAQFAIDQRRAPVALGLLVGDVGGQVEHQVGTRLPAQAGHQLGVACIAVGALAIAALAIGIDAVAQRFAQRPGGAHAEPRSAMRACADQHLGFTDPAWSLAHGIEGGAHGATAIHERGRTAQHIHAFVAPGVGRIGHGTCADTQRQPVLGHPDGVDPGEPTAGKRQPAVAGRAVFAYPDGTRHCAVDAMVRAFQHLFASYGA